MRTISGIWRWRRNPLRRPTDLLEAWLALAAALLLATGPAAAGWWAGRAAHGALLDSVRIQHRQRHPVWATAGRPVVRDGAGPGPETASRRARPRVPARWTAPDGGPRAGEVAAPRPVRPGERFRLWTDGRGRPVPRPMEASTARAHAVLAGLGTAALAAGLVEGGRRLALRQLTARRFRRWDAAWERAGQDWGRADAGS
ncbi:hypothetical protein ADL22_05490 [Streptomyces sp. NRRL F-4489]|uniref:Rv1733c family protein n=1 Tax=Streptomyces sp. NRRL F-4489 TaxID=1609095 RepID=UPI000746243C|nr:hypothetical protein [Streptomyces sp. NRRL F-4489]KUL52252.1 hypothetical protein ADL22_05490 [Streptomyces sp. NRRL F-4489]